MSFNALQLSVIEEQGHKPFDEQDEDILRILTKLAADEEGYKSVLQHAAEALRDGHALTLNNESGLNRNEIMALVENATLKVAKTEYETAVRFDEKQLAGAMIHAIDKLVPELETEQEHDKGGYHGL